MDSDRSSVGRVRARFERKSGLSSLSDQFECFDLWMAVGLLSTLCIRLDDFGSSQRLSSMASNASRPETGKLAYRLEWKIEIGRFWPGKATASGGKPGKKGPSVEIDR